MDFFSILAMVGGLSLFMYGMNTMGDGLSKLAGDWPVANWQVFLKN